MNLENYTRAGINDSITASVDYFSQNLEYTTSTSGIVDKLTDVNLKS